MLTQKRLKKLLKYSKRSGLFTRLVGSGRTKVGDVAGTRNPLKKYVYISVDGCEYLAHRLAFLYVTGEWPKNDTDHKNGVRHDNRWRNLRDVTRRINLQNRRNPNSRTKNPYLGICFIKRLGLWAATIRANDKTHSLGTHKTPELAHAAYLKAKREMHEGCTI